MSPTDQPAHLHSPDSGSVPETLHLSKWEEHRRRGGCGSGLRTEGGQLPNSGGQVGMYERQAAHLEGGYVSITQGTWLDRTHLSSAGHSAVHWPQLPLTLGADMPVAALHASSKLQRSLHRGLTSLTTRVPPGLISTKVGVHGHPHPHTDPRAWDSTQLRTGDICTPTVGCI